MTLSDREQQYVMSPDCSRTPGSIFAETIIPEDKRKEHIHVYLMIEYKNGLLVNSTQTHPISKLHNCKCYDYFDNSSSSCRYISCTRCSHY